MAESGKPVENEIIHAKDVTDELDKKVNTSDVLTYEEIMASTDLSGKVASASSIKTTSLKSIYIENISPQNDGFVLTPWDLTKFLSVLEHK